jgi:hypothetical protein
MLAYPVVVAMSTATTHGTHVAARDHCLSECFEVRSDGVSEVVFR